jgi:hypothetical protein
VVSSREDRDGTFLIVISGDNRSLLPSLNFYRCNSRFEWAVSTFSFHLLLSFSIHLLVFLAEIIQYIEQFINLIDRFLLPPAIKLM